MEEEETKVSEEKDKKDRDNMCLSVDVYKLQFYDIITYGIWNCVYQLMYLFLSSVLYCS